MALWQGKSKRKPTGGRLVNNRKKRRYEIGREPLLTNLGEESLRQYRTMGGNTKVKMLSAAYANVVDPKTNQVKRVRIVTVKVNPANPNYVQRNIMNRGATIQTDIGMARITSRPGQDGTVNAVLLSE
ncbi:MAG: 30S ribosomal protein S8e [Methanomassiliicoccus sp.]|nr:30S ribosomal protein S8e [Methanomassiliicoccus sp.]